MLENFIYAKQKSLFEEALNNGDVLDEAIVFIEDTKEIWNHGTYFDGNTFDPSNIEESIQNILNQIPTKLSQLENDSNYIQDDVVSDGVYAVDANGKLIDYNSADATALGVALVAGEHKFMIAKSDATNDGSNYNLYWTNNTSDLSLTNYTKSDGTNGSGYLPKPDGTFGGSTHLSDDFTTWTNGALSDFNGKANTAVIAAASRHAKDMCTVLNTFNASDSFKDWYVPACGQLALMYLNKTEINAALAKIGGTALAANYYRSSSEYSSNYAWYVLFGSGVVGSDRKGDGSRVRFIRDISVSKPLKERVSDLETNKQDTISDLETIRQGAAKGATALQSFTETDPIFSASPASRITEADMMAWYNKVEQTEVVEMVENRTSNKQDKKLCFTNVTASSWTADTTYTDFGYVCNLPCSGVTANMYAEVVFDVAQATSGNYAPICETGNGIVKIWSSTNNSITIPVIIVQK